MALGLPLLALAIVWIFPEGWRGAFEWLGYDLRLTGPSLSRLFATVFTMAAFAGNLFALRQSERPRFRWQ